MIEWLIERVRRHHRAAVMRPGGRRSRPRHPPHGPHQDEGPVPHEITYAAIDAPRRRSSPPHILITGVALLCVGFVIAHWIAPTPPPLDTPVPTLRAPRLATIPPPELPAELPPMPTLPRERLLQMIDTAAEQQGVERALAHAVVLVESAYEARAISPAGAIGLMQMMPRTAAEYGVRATTLTDPATNLEVGLRHLRRLLDKYAPDIGIAVMAYHAGEHAVERVDALLTDTATLTYADRVLRAYLANGGVHPVVSTLARIEQLRLIGAAGLVRRIERKQLDVTRATLTDLPPLSLLNIEPRLRDAPRSRATSSSTASIGH